MVGVYTMWAGMVEEVCVTRTRGFSHHVLNSYIVSMTKLQHWMTKNGKHDAEVARAVKRSRPQISRLRRGKTAASHATAQRLELLTGIRWWHFMAKKPSVPKKAARR